jgi:hypothetical protein
MHPRSLCQVGVVSGRLFYDARIETYRRKARGAQSSVSVVSMTELRLESVRRKAEPVHPSLGGTSLSQKDIRCLLLVIQFDALYRPVKTCLDRARDVLTPGIHMHSTILAAFVAISRTVVSMCSAGILLFLVGLWAAKTDIARASGLDKVVALSNLCFAAPLAVFGALHLSAVGFVLPLVPKYMPWRLFWAYFVGVALLATSLSIATRIQVRWSGLLFGIMMFVFVAMLVIPGVLAHPRDRFSWTFIFRESSFAGGGWLLAGNAMRGQGHGRGGRTLITVGRVLVAIAAIFFGVENFLHPANVPGVPLEKLMPAWIPARLLIGYLTGAILFVAGLAMLLARNTRMAATYLGTWLVLLVVFIYGAILIASLADPSTDVKIEGINYFFDTLLFAGAILALASATPRSD